MERELYGGRATGGMGVGRGEQLSVRKEEEEKPRGKPCKEEKCGQTVRNCGGKRGEKGGKCGILRKCWKNAKHSGQEKSGKSREIQKHS